MDSGTTTTSLESVLSLVVLRSTKKIKATTSSAEFAVLVFTSQLYSSQTFLFSDVNQSSKGSIQKVIKIRHFYQIKNFSEEMIQTVRGFV